MVKKRKKRGVVFIGLILLKLSTSFAQIPSPPKEEQVKVYTFGGKKQYKAVLLSPMPSSHSQGSLPLIVALHGRQEAMNPNKEKAAQAWPKDYQLKVIMERLFFPPLVEKDFDKSVWDPTQVELYNQALEKRPYRGAEVLCPSIPLEDGKNFDVMDAYGKELVTFLNEQIFKEKPHLKHSASVGIDGVSLGGAFALRIGLKYPAIFRAVGGIQPAIRSKDAGRWEQWARKALQVSPGLQLRLMTSEEDPFRKPVFNLSKQWKAANIEHRIIEVRGPHNYAFNRGPGGVELLFWHDRALK